MAYFYPTSRVPVPESKLPQMAGLALQLYGMKQQQSLTKKEQAMQYGTEATLGPKGQTIPATQGTVQRGLDVSEKQAQTSEAKLMESQKQFGTGDVMRIRMGTAQMISQQVKDGQTDKHLKNFDSVNSWFLSVTKGFDDPATGFVEKPTKGQMYDYIKSPGVWKSLQSQVVQANQKIFENKVKENPEWQNTPEAQKMLTAINQISSDDEGQFLDLLFPGVVRERVEIAEAVEIERLKAERTSEPRLTGEVSQFHQLTGRKPESIGELRQMKEKLRLPPQPTLSERDLLKRQQATEALVEMAEKDPNEAFKHGYKMNVDGTLYVDPVDNAPVKLPHFTKVLGKRGGPKMAKAAGEFWDDTVEIQNLINDPEVINNLQWAEQEGLWDRVKGSWSNKINLWLTKKGFSKTSKTTETIVRIQRLASIERLKFLGSAVTATELESILPWLPSAGDSFSTMITKTDVAAKEGEEVFRRYLDLYQDIADMSPFYKAFGIDRFPKDDNDNDINTLKSKYGLE